MTSTLLQMAALIMCGVFWRIARPAGLNADQTRWVLTNLVYYLLLPALVIKVLWQADIGVHSLRFTVLGTTGVFFGIASIWLLARVYHFENRQLGAIMLAASFPNVTYLGLPVLEQTFGPWARSVAIQMDVFATGPLVLTVGIMLARHYGEEGGERHTLWPSILRVPPLVAAAVAVALNTGEVRVPVYIGELLNQLSAGVVPLMLISLGLGLRWDSLRWRNVPAIAPVVVIKMFLMPLFAVGMASLVHLEHEIFVAAVLEMAMPCMVIGVVFCDRYRLDTGLYAAAVTFTTVLSLLTLPLWYDWLTMIAIHIGSKG